MTARRRKKSAAARVRPFWILILLVLAAAAAGGYYGASWSGFRAKSIAVSGNSAVQRNEIVQAAAISPHQNLWLQNMHAAVARIRKIPYIEDARVRRGLPATARIEVTERQPYAIVRGRDGALLVDRELRVLETGAERSDLPVFQSNVQEAAPGAFLRDTALSAMRTDYETLAKAHVAVRRLSFDRLGDLVVSSENGISIKLGDDTDLETKAALIEPILSQTQQRGQRVRALDLRAPKTPVIVYR